MKNSGYLILLLALGLVFVSYKWRSSSQADPAAAVSNATIEDIMTRTSVRAYSDRSVDSMTIDTLLHAAMAAPSAGNKQPWRFVVITDKSRLKYIGENFRTMKMATGAATAVVMCGDVNATFPGEGREYWVQDVSAASENLLLAAHALGLGAVWCGIYPQTERVDKFSEMLGLPDSIVPMACICIGYPAGQQTPKDKWNPENIRYNTWEATGLR
ncbi:MAG: nitroreductase family protein [Muribaculaceae bacterium]|nr:nitroreductase family protein [Muribaculaceae bacterium]